MKRLIKKFIEERRSQAALEYILLIGGIISVAVIVASVYVNSIRKQAEAVNKTTDIVVRKIACEVGSAAKMNRSTFINKYGFDCLECDQYGIGGAGTTWCLG